MKLLLVISMLVIAGCSSAPRSSVDVPVIKTEPDYLVRERNPDPAPEWMRDFGKYKRENDGKGQTYYMGESGDVSDRIAGCELSDLEAKKKISQQIATLITDKIAATKAGQLVIDKDNPNDPGLRKHFENTVAAKSMAFLSGVKQYSTYWEERDYSAVGGKKRVYNCSTVLMIDDKNLQSALQRASQKTTEVVEDPEAKSIVKEALKDIDSNFKRYFSKGN